MQQIYLLLFLRWVFLHPYFFGYAKLHPLMHPVGRSGRVILLVLTSMVDIIFKKFLKNGLRKNSQSGDRHRASGGYLNRFGHPAAEVI